MLQTSLRVRCRNQRCRSKLPIPTDNDHKAFCSRFCYDQFYNWKCVVCEAEIPRGKYSKPRKCCRSLKCNKDYRNFRDTYVFGLTEPDCKPDARNPWGTGAFFREEASRSGFRIVAGELSPSALWAATLPGSAATLALAVAARSNWQGWPAGKPHQPGELATEWAARELARRNAEDEQYIAEDEERLRIESVDDEGNISRSASSPLADEAVLLADASLGNYAVQPMEAA